MADVLEIRRRNASAASSSNDEHGPSVAEIMRGKALHQIHVTTALVTCAVFVGVSFVTFVGILRKRVASIRLALYGLCCTVGVAVSSIASVGNVYWDTRMLEVILVCQMLAAVAVATVCAKGVITPKRSNNNSPELDQ